MPVMESDPLFPFLRVRIQFSQPPLEEDFILPATRKSFEICNKSKHFETFKEIEADQIDNRQKPKEFYNIPRKSVSAGSGIVDLFERMTSLRRVWTLPLLSHSRAPMNKE